MTRSDAPTRTSVLRAWASSPRARIAASVALGVLLGCSGASLASAPRRQPQLSYAGDVRRVELEMLGVGPGREQLDGAVYAVRARAMVDLRCDADLVTAKLVQEVDFDVEAQRIFDVQGCGSGARYACYRWRCVREPAPEAVAR